MVLNVRTCFIKAEVSHPFGRTKISELWEWEGHQGPGLRGWSVHPGPLNRHREWGHFQHWGRSALPYSQWKIIWTEQSSSRKEKGLWGRFRGPWEQRKQCGDRKRNGKRKARGRGEKQLERLRYKNTLKKKDLSSEKQTGMMTAAKHSWRVCH